MLLCGCSGGVGRAAEGSCIPTSAPWGETEAMGQLQWKPSPIWGEKRKSNTKDVFCLFLGEMKHLFHFLEKGRKNEEDFAGNK